DRQHAVQPRLDVGEEVAGVGHDEVDRDEPPLGQALPDQRTTGGPPPIDGLLADPGFSRDALDREPVIALAVEETCRGVEDRLTCRRAAHGTTAMIVHHAFRIATVSRRDVPYALFV